MVHHLPQVEDRLRLNLPHIPLWAQIKKITIALFYGHTEEGAQGEIDENRIKGLGNYLPIDFLQA
ncbi:hypothetical protein C4900_06550 [Acidiferrobacter thiooxydans]|uniref:Uncharacterized protein n=1 Tax=Acidiferrobacter thiooxydans TaxID=163359 RepID=A0A368HJ08_9GAMM|nr:hypothetical protein C4900_06550 [Acidiferrobacter thiooxydans]